VPEGAPVAGAGRREDQRRLEAAGDPDAELDIRAVVVEAEIQAEIQLGVGQEGRGPDGGQIEGGLGRGGDRILVPLGPELDAQVPVADPAPDPRRQGVGRVAALAVAVGDQIDAGRQAEGPVGVQRQGDGRDDPALETVGAEGARAGRRGDIGPDRDRDARAVGIGQRMGDAEAEVPDAVVADAVAGGPIDDGLPVEDCQAELKLGGRGDPVADEDITGGPVRGPRRDVGLAAEVDQSEFELPTALVEDAGRRALAGAGGAEVTGRLLGGS
jgi:hypothetical protein